MSESHNCIHKHYKITSAGRTPKYWLARPPTLTYSIPLATLIYTRSTTLKSSVYFLIDDGGENGKSWPTWYFSDRANLILRNFLRCPMLTSEGHSRYCRWRKHWLQTCNVRTSEGHGWWRKHWLQTCNVMTSEGHGWWRKHWLQTCNVMTSEGHSRWRKHWSQTYDCTFVISVCVIMTSEGHIRYCRWRKHWLQTCKVNNCRTCPLMPAPFSTSRVLMLVFFIDET